MKEMSKDKQPLVYVIAFVLVVIVSFIYKAVFSARAVSMFNFKNEVATISSQEVSESFVFDDVIATETSEYVEESELESIQVYICGAVNNPGVYEVYMGSLLYEIVDVAGGFSEDAAQEYINLVYEINENISIYIPTNSEVSHNSYSNSELIRGSNDYFMWGVSEDTTDFSDVSQEDTSGKVNINTASREELMTLPGIGEATANAIIEYRNTNSFNTIEDIMNVSGIGESKFSRIRSYICV